MILAGATGLGLLVLIIGIYAWLTGGDDGNS